MCIRDSYTFITDHTRIDQSRRSPPFRDNNESCCRTARSRTMKTALSESRREQQATSVRIFILGGFRAERDGVAVSDDAWQRRNARSLIKLLATEPSHRLHREQIEDLLLYTSDAADDLT